MVALFPRKDIDPHAHPHMSNMDEYQNWLAQRLNLWYLVNYGFGK